MEPHRQEELLIWGGASTGNAAAAYLCPAAPASSSGRHALEQEVLHRADLQLTQASASAAGGAGAGDRRRERMIKNRASAARSRARRYAYVNELEAEVRLLRAENEQLRKLCEELKEAAEAPAPVKRAPQLQRSSSAPSF
ncbi:hypothetical protein ACP4OV_017686 [Aristida adscensionis]